MNAPIISFPKIKDKRRSTPLSISEEVSATAESRICALVNFYNSAHVDEGIRPW